MAESDIVANLIIKASTQGEDKIHGLGTAIKGLGLASAVVATGIGAAVKASMDWNGTLDTIQANTGSTNKQMAAMNDQIMALGKQSPESLNQIASGFERAANMSYRGADGLKVVTAAMEAAINSGGKTSDMANTLASVMRNFNIPAAQAAKTMDLLTATAQQGNIHLDEFAQNFGTVGASANDAHVKLGDAAAAMVALTQHGRNATEASTQVRAVIDSLTKASLSSTSAFSKMGKAAGVDLVGDIKKLRDGHGSLITILHDLEKATGGSSTAFGTLFANTRAMHGAQTLAGAGAAGLTKILDAQAHSVGTNAKLYQQNSHDLDFIIGRFKNLGQEGLIAIGNRIAPALSDLLNKGLAPLAGWFDSHQKQINQVFDGLGSAAGGAARLLQSGLMAGLQSIGSWIQAHQKQIADFGTALQTAFSNIKSFSIAGLGEVVKQLQSGSSAARSFHQMLDTIGSSFSGLGDSLRGVGQALGLFDQNAGHAAKSGQDFGRILGPVLSVAFQGIGLAVQGAIGPITGFFTLLSGGIRIVQQIAPQIQGAIAELGHIKDAIGAALSGNLGPLKDIGSAIVSAIGSGLSNLGAALGPLITQGLSAAGAAAKSAASALGSMILAELGHTKDQIGSVFAGIGSAIGSALSSAAHAAGSAAGGITSAVVSALGHLKDSAGAALGSLGNAITGALSSAKNAAGAAASGIAAAVVTGLSRLKDSAGAALGTLGNVITTALSSAKNAAGTAASAIASAVVAGLSKLKDMAGAALSGLVSTIKTAFTRDLQVGQMLAGFVAAVLGQIGNLKDRVAGAIGNVVGSIVSSLGSLKDRAGAAIGAFVGNVVSNIAALPGRIAGAERALVSSVDSAFGNLAKAAMSKLGDLAGSIAGWVGTEAGKMASAGGDLMEKLGSGISSKAGQISSALGSALADAAKGIGGAAEHLASVVVTTIKKWLEDHNPFSGLGSMLSSAMSTFHIGGGSLPAATGGNHPGAVVFGLPPSSIGAGPASTAGVPNAAGHLDYGVAHGSPFGLPGGSNAKYTLVFQGIIPGVGIEDLFNAGGGQLDFMHLAANNPALRVGHSYSGGTLVGYSGGVPGLDPGVTSAHSNGAHLHVGYDPAMLAYLMQVTGGRGFVGGPSLGSYGTSGGFGGGSVSAAAMAALGLAGGATNSIPAAIRKWWPQIIAASRATGGKVTPLEIAAVMETESGGNQGKRGSSGEIGLMQLMPGTAASLGVDPRNAGQNILGGARYLQQMLARFGSLPAALGHYNAGPGGNIGLPSVQNYIQTALGYMNTFSRGASSAALLSSLGPLGAAAAAGARNIPRGPMFPAGETGQEFADASFGGHFVTRHAPGRGAATYQQFVPATPDEGRYVIRRIPVPGGGSRTVRMWVPGRVLGTDRESSAGNTAISAFGRTAPSDADTYAARTQYLSDTMGKDLTAADAASARGMSGPYQYYIAQYARLFQESQRRAKLEAQTQIDAAKAAHDWTGEISASKGALQTDFQTALDAATVATHDHTGSIKAFVAEAAKDQRALDRWDRAAELSGEKISLASGHYADYLGAVTQRLQTGVANKVAQVAVTLQQGGQNIAGVVAAAARQTKQLDAITESQRQAQYMVDIAAGHFSDALSSLSQRVQQLLGNAGDRMTVALASGQQITASMIAGFKAAAAASVALAEAQRKSQLIQETVTAGLEVVVGKIDDLVKAITDTAAAVRQDIIRSLVAGQGIPAQDMADLARLRQNANDVAGFNAGVDTRIALGSGTLADVGSGVSQMMTVALDNWDRALMAGAGVINQYTAQVQQAATAQRAIDVANDARNVALGELTHNLDQLNSGLSGQFNRALGDMQFVTASMGRFGDGVKSSASNLGALASQALKAAQNLGSWDAIVQGISGVKNAALDAVRLSYGRSGGTADPGAIAAYAQASQAATRATWDQVGADLAAERSTQDVIGAQQTLGDEIGLAQSKLVWLGVTAGDNSAAFQAQQEVVNNLTTEQKGLQLAIDHWTNGTQLSADEQAQATKAVQRFTSGVDPATAAAQSMASVIGTSANDTSTALNNVKTSAGGLADSFLGIGPKLAGIADSLTQVATRLANIQTPNSVTVNTSGSVNVNSGGTLADQVNNSGTGLDPVSGSGGGTPSLPSGLGSAPGLATGGTGSLPGTTSGGGNGLPGMAATHAAAHGAAHAAAKPHQAAVHKAMAAAHKALAHAHAAATHGMHHAASHAAAAASAAATAASSATFTPGIAGTAAGSATGSSIAVAGAPNVNVTGYGTNLNATNIFGDITTSGTIQLTSAYGPYGGQLPPLPSGPGAPVEGQGGFYMWNGAKWTWMPGSPPGVPALSGNGTPALQIKGTALPAPIQEPNTSYTGGSWLGQQLPDMHLPTFAEGLKNLQAAIDSNALWLQQANVELAATTFIPLATIQALQSLGAAGALWGPGPYYQSGATGANGPFTAANNWGNGPQYTPEGAILGQTPPPTQDFWWGAGKDDGRTLLDAYHMGTPAAIAGFQQAARQKPTGLFDRLQASLTSLLFSHGGQQFMMRGNALYKSLGNGQFVAVPSGSLDGIIGGPPGARFNAAGGFVHSAVSGYPSYGVSSGAIQGSTPGNPMYVTGTHDQQMLQELQKLTKHQAQQLAIQQYQIGTLKLALHGLADAGLAIRDLEASGDQYLIDNLNLAKSVNSR